MDAKDLMLGDWVAFRKDYPDRVNAIAIGGHAVSLEHDGWQQMSSINPVPLTAEILNNNGFKDTDIVIVGTRTLRWASEDTRTDITIWLDDTMPTMEIRKNVYYEDEEIYTLPFPCTVHQFQHALRLCGIKKEIIL